MINGIHRLGCGCRWRQLPARFGSWQTIHKRHLLWSADGTWERLLQHAQADADAAGGTKIHLSADGKYRPLSLLITPRRLPDSVSADGAYSNSLIRTYLGRRGIQHAIPEKAETRPGWCSARTASGGAAGARCPVETVR